MVNRRTYINRTAQFVHLSISQMDQIQGRV